MSKPYSHTAEARFGAFVAPLLESYLVAHGLNYEVRDSHGPKATLELNYDGIVLVEVVRMISGRVCVTVRSDSRAPAC